MTTLSISSATTAPWPHGPGLGGSRRKISWDPEANSDVTDNPAGALKFYVPFDLVTYQGENQTCFQRSFGEPLDFAQYTKIHFDIKVDESSSRLSVNWGAGQFGGINLVARNADWSVQLGEITTADPWLGENDYGVWRHQAMEVDPTLTTHHDMAALMFHIWSGWLEAGNETGGHTNAVTFWVDNLYFEVSTNTAPPPPPTLALRPASGGLQLLATQTGGQWQRQNIRTVSDAQSWMGATGPVTYEMTIKDAPDLNGFQAHMFFIPNSTGDTAPDWNRPDALNFMIYDQGNGAGSAALGFKTNEPSGNSQIYGANHLADLPSTSILGTWKITFHQDTDITLTAPDGSTTNVVMPSDAAALFANPLTVYFGSQPGNVDYVGSGYVLSNVKITGTEAPLDDSFPGPGLDEALWVVAADDAPGVLVTPSDSKYWLDWTLPANGFLPQVNGTLAQGTWVDLDATASFKSGPKRTLIVPASVLPAGNQAYFRMAQREFTKLQVLLPGETAAPGTTTGKTGTPLPQVAGTAFDIVVNAVDDNWSLSSIASDMINITTTDGTATPPADKRLSNGTATFSIIFNDIGTFTVTATDVTDGTKPADTSSPVTVTW